MKRPGRKCIAAVLSLSLSACGGGGGQVTGGGPTGGGGTGGGGTSGCTLSARQDWALQQLDEWYLFPSLLDRTVGKANHATVQSYIDALVAPARAQSKDRYFTYITSIAEENALINSGSNAGFGIRLSYDTAANRVFVVEAFEGASGLAAGIDRGTEILAINGQSVEGLMQTGGPNAVINALGPSDAGVTRTFRIRQPSGVELEVSITKTDYSLDPVSDRYGVRVFDNDGTKVGYLNLRTFIVDSARAQLRNAFLEFKNQGVRHVILDLRYNGGGLISIAELLGDLLASDKTGQVFSRTVFRDSKASQNSTALFAAQPEAIAATKIAVIGREGTASASELVANSFIPYLGANLGLIGTDTYGKPVGQIALDRSACDDRLRAVAFKSDNAAGQGEYYSGLASVVQASCLADDGILTPLGDSGEASISVALDYLAGRSCTPIPTASAGVTVRAEERRRVLLQPRMPSPVQREVPGLF